MHRNKGINSSAVAYLAPSFPFAAPASSLHIRLLLVTPYL